MNYKKLLITAMSIQLSAMDERLLGNELENPYAAASAPAAQEVLESQQKDYSVHLDIAKLILDAYDAKLVDYNMPENQELTRKFINDPNKYYSDFVELLSVYYFATFDKDNKEETYFGEILGMVEKNYDKFINEKAMTSACNILSRPPIAIGGKGRHNTPNVREKGRRNIGNIGAKGREISRAKLNVSEALALRMFLRSAIVESEACKKRMNKILLELKEIRDTEMLSHTCKTQFTRQDLSEAIEYLEEDHHYQYISGGLCDLFENAINAEHDLHDAREMAKEEISTFSRQEALVMTAWHLSDSSRIARTLKAILAIYPNAIDGKCHNIDFLNELLEDPKKHRDEFEKLLTSSYDSKIIDKLKCLLKYFDILILHYAPFEVISSAADKAFKLQKEIQDSKGNLLEILEQLPTNCFCFFYFHREHAQSYNMLSQFISQISIEVSNIKFVNLYGMLGYFMHKHYVIEVIKNYRNQNKKIIRILNDWNDCSSKFFNNSAFTIQTR